MIVNYLVFYVNIVYIGLIFKDLETFVNLLRSIKMNYVLKLGHREVENTYPVRKQKYPRQQSRTRRAINFYNFKYQQEVT